MKNCLRRFLLPVAWVLSLVAPRATAATTLEVCKSGCAYRSIRQAVVAALPGDEVLVGRGVWRERINFRGKDISVRATDGPGSTVIHAGYRGGAVVSFVSGESRAALLDGFTITGGYFGSRSQGGIFVNEASPTISRCVVARNIGAGVTLLESSALVSNNVIANNYTTGDGGGIWLQGGVGPEIRECVITRNVARAYGGGIQATWGTGVLISGCTIIGNRAFTGGGLTLAQQVRLEDTTVSGNTARYRGGGIFSLQATLTVVNSVVSGNLDRYRGGGVYVDEHSTAILANCTIADNRSAKAAGAGLYCVSGATTVVNSVIWGNRAAGAPAQIATEGGSLAVASSDVEGGWTGAANLDADPLFNAPRAAATAPRAGGDYHIQEASPCRDAGTGDTGAYPALPPADIDGQPRPDGGAYDIGADEFTAAAPPLPVFTVEVPDPAAAESGNRGRFLLTHGDPGVNRPLVLFYGMSGSAGNGRDYHRLSGTTYLPAGYTGVLLGVIPRQDDLHERRESVILTLRPSTGYLVGAPASGTVRIRDDD